MVGTRKFWMTVAVLVALLVGLVVTLAFKTMTDGMWTAWCSSVAGTGLVGVAANVVTKKITEPRKKAKR